MVSLKSRVSGMAHLLLPSFVILPVGEGDLDVPLLALFRAAAKHDDHCVTVLGEVNPVARTKVELVFKNSGTDTLDVRQIPERDPGHGRRYLRSGLGVQVI